MESVVSILLIAFCFPSFVVPSFVNILVYLEDVSVSGVVHRSLENKFILEIKSVTICYVTHEPLDRRYQSNMSWFKGHTNVAFS
jgi:hypothetical protein